jgi:hypothetical protein
MFHGDRFRSGWNPAEWILTPSAVATGNFGKLWDTGRLDLDPSGNPPHFYASPLYVDVVTLTTPDLRGLPFHVVIAASTAGYVYAINAFDGMEFPRVESSGPRTWVDRLAAGTAFRGAFSEPRRSISTPFHPPSTWPATSPTRARETGGSSGST